MASTNQWTLLDQFSKLAIVTVTQSSFHRPPIPQIPDEYEAQRTSALL